MLRSNKSKGVVIGILLGFGAPVGSLFFNILFVGQLSTAWLFHDIQEHGYFYVYMTITAPAVFGCFGYFLGQLNDQMSSQKKSLESLNILFEHESMTDALTGLYNYRHIVEEIERELARAKRYGRILSGMMIDIDDFKSVNDNYGHLTGDAVIREVASIIKQNLREVDIVGRYGGDEFLVILPETNILRSKTVAERIQQGIRQYHFKTMRDYFSLTVSIGLFCFEDIKGLDKNSFIEKVDATMFRAKNLGKDKIFFE